MCSIRRHASCLNRLEAIAPNATTAVPAVRAAIRGYCANESTAKDIISTVWIILDHDLDNTASIINGIVDTLDEDEKKSALLSAWNSFRIEVCITQDTKRSSVSDEGMTSNANNSLN